jgi:hypothetical protein
MKLLKTTLLTALVLPFLIAGCIEKPVEPVVTVKTVTITGKVLRSDNLDPIPGALVTLVKTPPVSARTDSTGTYRLSFDTDASLTAVIVTVVSGFSPDTTKLKVDPGKDFTRDVLLEEVLLTGLPDQAHFTLTVDKLNFPGLPGLVNLGATNTIRVRTGDKSGSPVALGTQINFSTHGGTIDRFAFTDASGFAKSTLYGGNPVSVDAVHGRGFSWVKAYTVGEGGTTVQDSSLVLFSGTPEITGPASGFTLRDGGTQSFEYTVADENGNPLASSTAISLSVSGSSDVKLDGDVNIVLPDTQDRDGYTKFTFTLTDTKPLDAERDQDLSITISVTGPNGDKSYTFTGKLLSPDASIGAGTGPAAAIALVQLDRNAISVREAGGTESSVITFEAHDSVGRAVDQAHQVTVSFVLQGGPGGGEYVSPASATTDAQTGRVRTTVNAGYKAGALQVVAQATVAGNVIRSAPVIINIWGGFPDQQHISIVADKYNTVPCVYPLEPIKIRVVAGDKYSNPVRPGTPIYFSTTGGVINIRETAYTDDDGKADAELSPCNPIPPDGLARISASTVGEHGETVTATLTVVFSEVTTISMAGPASDFTLPDGGSLSFQYLVADPNGNQLTAGTTIDVSVSGSADVMLSGDINVVLPETQDREKYTRFSFTLTDTKPLDKEGNKPLTITISVASPSNGNRSYTFTGTLLGSAISGGTGTGTAAAIALIDASLNAISVKEVGGDETSLITFEVRDSLGVPVDAQHQASVAFFIQSGPGGGEYIAPTTGTTQGSTGHVQTTLSSGTKAGVVQIVAQTTVGSRTIRSAPVIVNIFGGFPDQAHFSIGPNKLNFPGYDILNLTNTITVIAGDKYSNPVRPGTAVYFRTTGGTINVPSTAYTTDDGIAVATLRSGNPRPYDPIFGAGFAYVTASTVGESGNTVSDSALVLFSGISRIYGLSASSFAVPAGGSSGPINFKVSDENGNPLSSGTVITLTLQYIPPPNTTINLAITGDINVTLGDVQAKGSGTTDFSFQVVDQTAGGVPTPIPVTVVISVTSPNGKPPNASISGTVG